MIKLIVFDWNGVLIADAKACFEADNNVLKNFGGRTVNFRTWRSTIAIPSIDFYTLHGVNKKELLKNKQKWADSFHKFYEKRVSKIRTRKNVHKTLKWLNDYDIKCIILSNHTAEGIDFQLKRLGIGKFIHFLLANSAKDTSLKARNKLEKMQKFIHKNNYKNQEIIIVGDSPEEIEIGKSLGLKTIAITNGYYSISRLKKSRPDYLITNLNELKRIINQ